MDARASAASQQFATRARHVNVRATQTPHKCYTHTTHTTITRRPVAGHTGTSNRNTINHCTPRAPHDAKERPAQSRTAAEQRNTGSTPPQSKALSPGRRGVACAHVQKRAGVGTMVAITGRSGATAINTSQPRAWPQSMCTPSRKQGWREKEGRAAVGWSRAAAGSHTTSVVAVARPTEPRFQAGGPPLKPCPPLQPAPAAGPRQRPLRRYCRRCPGYHPRCPPRRPRARCHRCLPHEWKWT